MSRSDIFVRCVSLKRKQLLSLSPRLLENTNNPIRLVIFIVSVVQNTNYINDSENSMKMVQFFFWLGFHLSFSHISIKPKFQGHRKQTKYNFL